MDGWMGDRWDAAQFGTYVSFSPPGEETLFLFFKESIKDCYDYLTICLSHFTLTQQL